MGRGKRIHDDGAAPPRSDVVIEKIDRYRFRLPKSQRKDMRVDGLVFADHDAMRAIEGDNALVQVANVACLPGIVKYSLAMPDIHWGYGFCIGGVAATDPAKGGVISPGGVGYDINCGVRLIRTDIPFSEAAPLIGLLVDQLFALVPCGVGQSGSLILSRKELTQVLVDGSSFAIKKGFGWQSDIEVTEAGGRLRDARPDFVSDRAYERGADQCGTLGSGNHFLEVQVVDEVFDADVASAMGLRKDHLTVMIHSGSRGLGYQVCDDALRLLQGAGKKYGIVLPDRQLASAPIESSEGQQYLGAMRAAANFAWASRQVMTHLTREAFSTVFDESPERLGMHVVYDVAHNIAKLEKHTVDGKDRTLCVHRKGATRAFPRHHPELPPKYREIGQPVLVPGDMGRYSYVLTGQPGAMEESFGSCCHGAGRRLSRGAASRLARGRDIRRELLDRGIVARARSRSGLDEEQPDAYKDVREVVDIVDGAGLSRLTARLRPVGVIKG